MHQLFMECAPVQELFRETSPKRRVVNHIRYMTWLRVKRPSHNEFKIRDTLRPVRFRFTINLESRSCHMSQSSQSARPSPMVGVVVFVVLAQAVALFANAVLILTEIGSNQLPAAAVVFLVFLFILAGIWLAAAARGVYQGKAWPRGALIVAEVLAVIVSFTYFQLGDILLGAALVISGG